MAAMAVWTIGQRRGRIRAGSARGEEITPYVLAHRAGGPGAGAPRAGPRASPPPSLRRYQPEPSPEPEPSPKPCCCCCCWLAVVAGRLPSLTCSVLVWPPRRTVTATVSPGLCASTSEDSDAESSTVLPATEVITSPVFRPALAAGAPWATEATCAPAPEPSWVDTPR